MIIEYRDLHIDKELDTLLPQLSKDDYDTLEQSLLQHGFSVNSKIQVYTPYENNPDKKRYIIDGHNRYKICKEHNIPIEDYQIEELAMYHKEQVKMYMIETQLGRRNLSEVQRYEIIQEYNKTLKELAKKNQRFAGNGLTNLTKINVRKESAKLVGVSEGTYRKIDKVMKSNNEEVKQKLKDKKISVDKAYKEVQELKQETPTTPMQRIEKVDNRIDEIEREISSLHIEKQALIRKRTTIFDALDIKCELKYEFTKDDLISRECSFYIEVDGHKQVFVECGVFYNEEPHSVYTSKVPDKYKNDFKMLYRKAHFEDIEFFNVRWSEFDKKQKEKQITGVNGNVNKDFQKKCFRILAKNFHPDNGENGSMEDMKSLNQLKQAWGI